MKGKKILCLFVVALFVSISFISSVEARSIENHITTKINEKVDNFRDKISSLKNHVHFKNFFSKFTKGNILSLASNFTSLDLIGALFGSLLFLLITQPIFLQFIVETGNQFLFIVILISLLFIESFQKLFSLKIIGFWDPYIKGDVDGIWNFFSIVFFTSYIKIYLSYLPTFIIQYSNVFTKAFFYALMFAIPILFNICIADSIDMIDWNGDEFPTPP